MATLEINGMRVEVDDSFRGLTPEQQQATVNEIMQSLPQQESGPMITVGDQQMSVSQYQAMPDNERQALRDQISDANPDAPGMVRSSPLDPFVQGTTFGWGDELRGLVQGGKAAMQGGDFGQTYDQTVEESRQSLERERRVNPVGSFAAELGGAIPTGMLAGGQLAGRGGQLWQKMISGGMVGAGQGSVYGAGAAEDDNRAEGGAWGGGLGLGAGLAVPAIATGAGAAYRNIADQIASTAAARRTGTSPEAARFLTQTMAADDALSPAGQSRMAAAGDEAMLADAGPSARNALDYAIQGSGRAGTVAREAIDARVSRDARALQDALDGAMGRPTGTQTLRAGIRDSSASARSSAYNTAYDTPIDYSTPEGMALQDVLSRVSQADLDAANNLMRMEGHQSKQILAQVADDGSVEFMRLPDVRQIDYITRALNDRAQSNAGLGAMGGQTNEGRVYQNLSGELRDLTRGLVDEYDTALNTAADPIRRSQAVQFGADMFRSNMARDVVADRVAQMTGPEREAAKQGARSYIDDLLSRVTRTVQDGDTEAREAIAGLRLLGSRATREKLSALLGDDEARALLDEVDRVSQSFDLRAAVADNSKTFQRMNMGQRLNDLTQPEGPIATLARGEPVNAAKSIVQSLTGRTPQRSLQDRERILEEIARLLTGNADQSLDRMSILRQLSGSMGASEAVHNGIMSSVPRMGIPAATAAIAQR